MQLQSKTVVITGAGRGIGRGFALLAAQHGAKVIVNAAGVWAAGLVPGVALRPARGTHLVFDGARFAGLRVALTLPIPGAANRYALVLPQPDGRVYAGLTDEDAGPVIPDVPEPGTTTKLAAEACKTGEAKSLGKVQGGQGEYEKYSVELTIEKVKVNDQLHLAEFKEKVSVFVPTK